MGWLFAVALGLQERSRRAVLAAVPPIAAGHALAVVAALALLQVVRTAVSPRAVALATAATLVAFGVWRLVRRRHPRWVGMRVRPRELALWSFVMASAHGAGLMLFPVLLAAAPADVGHPATGLAAAAALGGAGDVLGATLVHTAAMLAMMAAVAVMVYDRLGVAVLRRAWVNLDVVWAAALVGAGGFALFT
ncbi:MAG: hypothetical protein M3N17_02955 [Actinomycetota bacterium]|nr:hypothetical protein [Actinomycetota bacterium]